MNLDKMWVAVGTFKETGEKIVILDQDNKPVLVTLSEALKLKFEGFPYSFAPVREMYDIIEIEVN
jgi:hypothetical protein